jgi:DNA (cytosine-5)-methyltransferase 1
VSDASPKLIDLFAGCGGLALGFHQAGFKTALANELHIDPATTYSRNLIPDSQERMLVGPIEDRLSDRVLEEKGIRKFEIDCIAGGPPCQGFSMAGRGNPDDPRNTLFREYLRVVSRILPKTVIFENVPGFANRYGLMLRKKLEQHLSDLGYLTASGVLEARDYGVPQLRRRFICMGVHKEFAHSDEVSLPSPTWPHSRIEKDLTARKVIGDLDVYSDRGGYGTGEIHGPECYLRPAKTTFQREMRELSGTTSRGETWNTRIPMHTETVAKRMRAIQSGSRPQDFHGTELETRKLSQRLLQRDKFPRITVVSLPDDYVHYSEKLPRTLSVRECARLQTFPDHYRFYGKRTTGGIRRRSDVPQYTQVGNAIPPRMAKSLAEEIVRVTGI